VASARPGNGKGKVRWNRDQAMATELTSNYLMLRRTPQMLKKSRINRGNPMNYLEFIVLISYVCVEKQMSVEPRDAIGER